MMRMRYRSQLLRNQKGISLVEVLAAVLLLGVALVVFIQLSDYNLLAIGKSAKANQAIRIADNYINLIREDIQNSTPHASFPLNESPIQCNQTSPWPICQQLPASFEVTIRHQPYIASEIHLPAVPADNQQVSVPALIHYNNTPTLITVTVNWR